MNAVKPVVAVAVMVVLSAGLAGRMVGRVDRAGRGGLDGWMDGCGARRG